MSGSYWAAELESLFARVTDRFIRSDLRRSVVSGRVGAGQKEGDVVVHWSIRGQGVDDRCT